MNNLINMLLQQNPQLQILLQQFSNPNIAKQKVMKLVNSGQVNNNDIMSYNDYTICNKTNNSYNFNLRNIIFSQKIQHLPKNHICNNNIIIYHIHITPNTYLQGFSRDNAESD